MTNRSCVPLAAVVAALMAIGALFPALAAGGADPAAGGADPAAARFPVERLTIPFPQDDGSLSPYTFELGYSLMTLLYDTLMWRDDNGLPQPWLAKLVTPSTDGKRITVVLADRAKWHDGRPVTSADIAFSFAYIAEHEHPRFSAQLAAIERVERRNDSTAVIVLKNPSPGFFQQALSDVPILPEHLWQDLPPGRLAPEGLPVGSGPYRLVRYLEDESYRFQANEEHFLGRPAVKFIEMPFINDSSRMFTAFELGRADMIPVTLPAELIQRVQGIDVGIARGPVYLGTVLMFNLRRPPFDKPEVRRAVASALDLGRISQAARPARAARKGYLHPSSQFAPREDLPPQPPQEPAQTILTNLAVGVLTPDNDPVKLEAGRQVALALRRMGANAEARPVSRDELSRAVGEDGSPPSYEAAIWSSSPLASYDPDFLRRVFSADPEVGTFNFSGYKNPEFDRLANSIAVTPQPQARQARITDALRLLSADLPVIPLFFSDGAFAFRQRRYDGWVFVKGTGILDKRSFSRPRSTGRTPVPAPTGSPSGLPRQKAPGGFPFGIVAAGFLVTAAAVGVVALFRKRS